MRGRDAPATAGRMPALRFILSGVVVGLAGAFERDLVVGEGAAFWYRRGLGLRIGLGFRRRLHDFADVGWVNAADWSDHRDRIGRGRGIFNRSAEHQKSLVRVTGLVGKKLMRPTGVDRGVDAQDNRYSIYLFFRT